MLDIHHFARQHAYAVRFPTSKENQRVLQRYHRALVLHERCGIVRQTNIIKMLKTLARLLPTSLEHATKDDLQRLLLHLNRKRYASTTIHEYRGVIRGFYHWLDNEPTWPDGTPSRAAWTTSVRHRRRLQRSALLTPADVQTLLDHCRTDRDRAIIAILWETGCRIAELGNLQRKHVTPVPEGFLLDLTGKTGERTPLIITSAPYLASWLNHHAKRDPEHPLWTTYDGKRALSYDTLHHLVHQHAEHLKKRVYPHLFRHSRATFLLASGVLNDAQARAYFGWTPSSTMLSTYAHLLTSDANTALARAHGLHVTTPPDFGITTCACGTHNTSTSLYCTTCAAPLPSPRPTRPD